MGDMLEQLDGDLVVYPRRLDLLLYACAQILVLGAILAGAALLFVNDPTSPRAPAGIVAVGILALLLLYFAGSDVLRFALHRPAIIVNDEGVIDNWSLGYGGIGLIRWSEIDALSRYVNKTSAASQHFFVIFPHPSVLDRRSRLQRVLSSDIRFSVPGAITISCRALPLSPAELLAEIERRFARQVHAHHIRVDGPGRPPNGAGDYRALIERRLQKRLSSRLSRTEPPL